MVEGEKLEAIARRVNWCPICVIPNVICCLQPST
jgi:hypothetical protein